MLESEKENLESINDQLTDLIASLEDFRDSLEELNEVQNKQYQKIIDQLNESQSGIEFVLELK